MGQVEFKNVSKFFEGGVHAVENFTLTIEDGEFVVLVGPSGCGKSTTLRMVAGLEEISEGEIRINGETVNGLPPQQRNIAMVFQNYALYPHKTVRKNLEFPLRMMKLPRNEIDERVERASRLLGLGPYLDRRPKALSGGQRQRVAMGRAIVRDPAVFLMDEPLSNLDAKLRVEIRAEIAALQRDIGVTTLYVTHDQVEAMTLGDRVAVLHDGRLQQVAPAQELYDNPVNTFVATFIGSPQMNIFRATLHKGEDGTFILDFGEQTLQVDSGTVQQRPQLAGHVDKPILAGLRPEAFVRAEGHGSNRIGVRVHATEALGHEQIVYFEAPVPNMAETDREEAAQRAAQGNNTDHALMAARLSTRRAIGMGETITLSVDTDQLYFFDETGEAIS